MISKIKIYTIILLLIIISIMAMIYSINNNSKSNEIASLINQVAMRDIEIAELHVNLKSQNNAIQYFKLSEQYATEQHVINVAEINEQHKIELKQLAALPPNTCEEKLSHISLAQVRFLNE